MGNVNSETVLSKVMKSLEHYGDYTLQEVFDLLGHYDMYFICNFHRIASPSIIYEELRRVGVQVTLVQLYPSIVNSKRYGKDVAYNLRVLIRKY